tara:strand:+ start:168 stop:1346 length:1179 start_codon:yes stop_codon:yes gene_type:complete
VYKSCGFGILFFIIINPLINAQSAYLPLNELQYNEDNTCHIKFHSSHGTSIISKKERKKIKSLICEHLDMVSYMDSVFEPFDLPPFFSKIPLITCYSNFKSPRHLGVGVWNLNYITALNNGLIMNYFIDERLDYKKSTIAAANELNRLWKIYGQKKATLLAFLISPNFVFNQLKRPDLTTPNIQGIDMLLKLDSAIFQYDKIYNNNTETNQSYFSFLKPLSFDAIYDFKKLDFDLILKNNQVLLRDVLPADYPILLSNDVGNFLKNNESKISIFQDSLNKNSFFKNERLTEHKIHKVVKGDVLGKIAYKYNVSVRNLMEWNNLNSSLIYVDQNLIVGRIAYNDHYETYTFKEDKSLQFWEIAKKHDCSVREINEYNRYQTQNFKIKLKKKNP